MTDKSVCNCVAAACQEFGCAVAAGFVERPLVEPVTFCDCCGASGPTTYYDEPAAANLCSSCVNASMEPFATTMVDGDHAAYVDTGAITTDPTLLPDYDAAQPEPGVLLVVVDRAGWGTLHRVEARDRSAGTIEFSARIAWPDGSTAARTSEEIRETAAAHEQCGGRAMPSDSADRADLSVAPRAGVSRGEQA